MKEASFYIEQMTCQACSSGIERALKRKSFCHSIDVHLISKKAHICYDESQTSLEEIFAIIRKMGYEPHLGDTDSPHTPNPTHNIFIKLNDFIEFLDARFLNTRRRFAIL